MNRRRRISIVAIARRNWRPRTAGVALCIDCSTAFCAAYSTQATSIWSMRKESGTGMAIEPGVPVQVRIADKWLEWRLLLDPCLALGEGYERPAARGTGPDLTICLRF